jgi:hypothetical protein
LQFKLSKFNDIHALIFLFELGIGSNLVGIQTSRLSTFLHQTAPKGKLPKSNPRPCIQPFAAFIGRGKQIISKFMAKIRLIFSFIYLL